MFDASKIYDEVPENALAETYQRLNRIDNPLSYKFHKTLLERELYQIEFRCNMVAWGYHAADLPTPTSEEAAELLKKLSSPSFIRDAIEAASLRYMLAHVDRLILESRRKYHEEWDRIDAENAAKKEREAFEAHEASEREKRFKRWRNRR